jgi:hypothetical protein
MAYRGSSDHRLMLVDIGGQKIGVYYRSPTPSEYICYHRDKLKFRGGKIENNLTEANLRFGLKLITGIRPGDLEYRENGAWKELDTSMMPEAEWKALLDRDFLELVDFVGSRVFNPVESSVAENEEESPAEDIQKK